MNYKGKLTDTIPRADTDQIFSVLSYLSSTETTFDEIRGLLQGTSGRKTPGSRAAMWTVARDVLSELQRLEYANVGPLPRERSDLDRLRKTPCRITDKGLSLAALHRENRGRAYDELLITWLNEHPYFRALVSRLMQGPLHIPDITNTKQVGIDSGAEIDHQTVANAIIRSCVSRLERAGSSQDHMNRMKVTLAKRAEKLENISALGRLDAKTLVDAVQDWVVLPALLAAEDLPFDAVTFQQILKISQEFYCASWTSSHPDFQGRIAFATCELHPLPISGDTAAPIAKVVHHGRSYASSRFRPSLISAYNRLAQSTGSYVKAYALRAIVCLELGIQPEVFGVCLKNLIDAGPSESLLVYTELPFSPSPPGETYIEVGRSRIGRIKLSV